MGLHTAQRWIVVRPNFHCWSSVKNTRKIFSSSVTCLVLMSYCTSWWHRFDWSSYGIIESYMFNLAGKQGQFDQWLDYKSCWQISSHRCWYFYISAITRFWSNAFRTWKDFSSSLCCISVGEFSWYIISVDVVNSVWDISLRAPLLILIAVCSQTDLKLVRTQHSNDIHGLCRQMHWPPGRSSFASPGISQEH